MPRRSPDAPPRVVPAPVASAAPAAEARATPPPSGQGPDAPPGQKPPHFRSAAVARMAHMPVATLRIWEQRHRAVQPQTTASGHRMYRAEDVQRVLLLRQLTQQGHAIGAIAAMDSSELRALHQRLASAAPASSGPLRPGRGLRLVVVGAALGARLQRPAVSGHWARPVQHLTQCTDLAEAAHAGPAAGLDLLLVQAPVLTPDGVERLQQAQQALRATHLAVVYRHAAAPVRHALQQAGAALLREPADDDALGRWLASLEAALQAGSGATAARDAGDDAQAVAAPDEVPPRRYDDATLTALAGLPPTLACECPRHLAELLMQLGSFEAYSASCIHRDTPDALLHAHLQRVAAQARALLEAALTQVARHEGFLLP